METPKRSAVLPDHQFHGLLQYVNRADTRRGTGQFKLAVEKIREVFSQLKTDDREQVFRELAKSGRELQSVCLRHAFDP
jgi:hypothetical protein